MDRDRRHRPEWPRAGALILKAFRIPITWGELIKRTFAEVQADNCLGLAAQLSYYFFLALFPALLFMVAVASFFPIAHPMDDINPALVRVATYKALQLIQDHQARYPRGLLQKERERAELRLSEMSRGE